MHANIVVITSFDDCCCWLQLWPLIWPCLLEATKDGGVWIKKRGGREREKKGAESKVLNVLGLIIIINITKEEKKKKKKRMSWSWGLIPILISSFFLHPNTPQTNWAHFAIYSSWVTQHCYFQEGPYIYY